MMIHKVTWCFTIFLAVINTQCRLSTVSVSGETLSIYRLKTRLPFEQFRNNQSNVFADIKDLILELPPGIDPLAEFSDFRYDILPPINNERSETDMCSENNGNCSQKCETVSGKAICSCREGFSITESGDCTEVDDNDAVLSGTSGKFITDHYYQSFVIRAPENHIIKCVLTAGPEYDNELNYMFSSIKVYDSEETIVDSRKTSDSTREWISSGPYLKVRQDYVGYGSFVFQGMYETGPAAIVPNDWNARISIPLSTPGECYSISFLSPKEETASSLYSVMLEGQEIQTHKVYKLKVENSQRKTHIIKLPTKSDYQKLTFHFEKYDTKVYSVRKCLNIERHAVRESAAAEDDRRCINGGSGVIEEESCNCPIGFTGKYCEEEDDRRCINGRSGVIEEESCNCPIGFTGKYCEEGCGPNRYGENCTHVCSKLSSKCEGVIFCTEQMCSCAPGLRGASCVEPCSQGWYGASCQRPCGKCKDDKPCDIYTGKCYSGCATGFYPPLCQQTYKVLQNVASTAEVGYTYVTLSILFKNITGGGEAVFYEVQYRDLQDESWTKLTPRIISNNTKCTINGLLPGKKYAVRIILIDKDGGSYQYNVPETTVMTKCIEREDANYHFGVQNVSAYELDFEWTYKQENNMVCEIEKFELLFVAGEETFIIPLAEWEGNKRISDLLPDTEYSFQLIGETVTGKRVIPPKQPVRTLSAAPSKVRDIRVAPSEFGTELLISWQPPWNSAETPMKYKVNYECAKIFACENISCPSSGHMEVQTNSVLLEHLNPHALYEIKIAAVSLSGETGEEYAINATTAHTAPQATPAAEENPILSVTNTSVSIKWMPPTDCTQINGYLNGYSYRLIDKETKHTLYEGSVTDYVRHASFSDLVPRHCYEALVAVAATGGTDFRNILVIPFCTTSTAPDQVQALEVYKRGRRMVGLRWGLPVKMYGDIESFTITYNKMGKTTNKSVVVEPEHCKAWPHLYCHTITNLSPGKKYKFVVQARNAEVNTDGAPVSVETITTEGASTPPRNLRIINATENSVLLGWEIPDNINGQLRSFIVVAEQIDINGNSEECCDDIPLLDFRVTSEQSFYTYEVTGLKAATTYSVAVAAKTVSVGEQALITVHTPPPQPHLPLDALTIVESEDSSSDRDTLSFKIQPAESITGVNRTYIILLLTKLTRATEEFDDPVVADLLHSEFGNDYRIVSEYTEEEIEEEPIIKFRPRDQSIDIEDIQSQKYALVLIQEYMGLKSMDFFVTNNN